MIPEWQAIGYRVKLIFLSLPNVEMAIERVATRIMQGGHDVSKAIIKRRFEAGIHNFNKIYKSLVDAWTLYDNSGEAPDMLEQGGNA